ncbi:MAG: adenylyltransferase/cytidyltransferase family protein [Gammaproteobacteria bacterium]|nr:adenylyltransferase/cytidyltransferase family protein [Gammaproteobacteria bacterium]
MCQDVSEIINDIRARVGSDFHIVFVWGNFNVVHPGHLRLLNFAAECGDFLVVGVTNDGQPGTLVPAKLRLEGIRAISIVDYSFLLQVPPESFIANLKPDIVVKGKEHEQRSNPEQPIVESYGGKLLFSSGEVRFSSLDLLQQELRQTNLSTIRKPTDYVLRHGIDVAKLAVFVRRLTTLRVLVIGDLIVDEYITCDPLGMSQEDPTIVVTPITQDLFVGGAGIVAAHARGLGADVKLFSIVGNDQTAMFAQEKLSHHGVQAHLIVDGSRPTTLKQRYRAHGKTLLRVSHLRQHGISSELIGGLLEQIAPAIDQADLVIFSDFNYGCLPQDLVDEVIVFCARRDVMMVADSQASSQTGDISRFHGMRLITPTEHEARLAVRDPGAGLTVMADALHRKSHAGHVFITLGVEGLLIHAPTCISNGLVTDQLPALNTAPRDVSGAGDSLLTCASMALAVGANVWESAYLGSIAAACQVGRVGNLPLSAAEIMQELLQ